MKVKSVHIRNYRSLKDVTVNLQDYTCLIGRNDSGKSSFLYALRLLFDPESQFEDNDLCKIEAVDGQECFIEATLEHKSPDSDDTKIIRIRRLLSDRYRWEILGRVPKHIAFKMMQAGTLTKDVYNSDSVINDAVKSIIGTLPPGKVKSEYWKANFQMLDEAGMIDNENGWEPLNPDDLGQYVKPIFLRADVKAEDEVSDKGSAIFSQIGGLLMEEAIQNHPELQKALTNLKAAIDNISSKDEFGMWTIGTLNRLQELLQEEITSFDSAVTVSTNIVAPRMQSVNFGISLDVSDEWVDGLRNLGHGLQRSVVFAMLRTLRRLREVRDDGPDSETDTKSQLHLFLVEEPELYLHPQAERQRMQDLVKLSDYPNAQVALCTHSAFFVDLSHYKGILRFERPDRKSTIIHSWDGAELNPTDKKTLDTTYHFDPTRAAMLFADKVILVEGQTEKVTVPPLADRMGLTTDGVEVVDCGGNGSIPTYQRVLEEFDVKYVAWFDDKEKTEVKRGIEVRTLENGRIVLTDKNWEHMAKLSGDKDKPYHSWLKYIYNEEEPNKDMKDRITAAYNWYDYPSSKRVKRKGEELDELPI